MMPRTRQGTHTVWAVYRWPVVIAAISALGLTFALLGDGFWDAASWLLLGSPALVGLHFLARRA
ncbi:MAG: hypothetical protein JHD07_08425 [Bradyrhizobium sp.]|jgi:hypothetical protein|nr:hypothetical protein [Bradyrhizobium sp.]